MVRVGLHNEPRFKVYGILATITFHGLLLLFLLFRYLVTPIPPYPEGGGGPGMGIEVNLGSSDEGLGIVQPDVVSMPDFKEETKVPVKSKVIEQNEKIVTQDIEETPPVNNAVKEEKKKKTIKKDQPVQEVKQVVNPKALYRKSSGNVNQGVVGGTGDQGNANGTKTSNLYKGTGGTGTGEGSGGGTGGGTGTGTGNGVGNGISFNLNGRLRQFTPNPEYIYQTEGNVVVEITVDQDGKVTNAIPGVKGSTTLDDRLLSAAKKAALASKFNATKNAASFQKGTITYRFKLK